MLKNVFYFVLAVNLLIESKIYFGNHQNLDQFQKKLINDQNLNDLDFDIEKIVSQCFKKINFNEPVIILQRKNFSRPSASGINTLYYDTDIDTWIHFIVLEKNIIPCLDFITYHEFAHSYYKHTKVKLKQMYSLDKKIFNLSIKACLCLPVIYFISKVCQHNIKTKTKFIRRYFELLGYGVSMGLLLSDQYNYLYQLPYSRNSEFEADAYAFDMLLSQNQIEEYLYALIWLADPNCIKMSKLDQFLSTHPHHNDRIQAGIDKLLFKKIDIKVQFQEVEQNLLLIAKENPDFEVDIRQRIDYLKSMLLKNNLL